MRQYTDIVGPVLLGTLAGAPSWSTAQGRPDPAALFLAQRIGDTDWPSAGAIGPQ